MAETTSMLRTVVTQGDAQRSNGLPDQADDYKTRLVKLIPAETVAFYTGLAGIPESLQSTNPGYYWPALIILFLAGLIGTPLILKISYGMTWQYKKGQFIITMAAYILYVASLGTFQGFNPVPPAFMTIIFAVFTFIVAPFVNPGTNTSGQQR
jgi:hypothetical protein